MTAVNMDLVKELREKTQAGLLDCKKALAETHGDIEKAVDLLRKKGAAVAVKRADMATLHGVIAAATSPDATVGALVEIGCETDFAANTEAMQTFAKDLAHQTMTHKTPSGDIEALLSQKALTNPALTVKQVFEELIGKIRENIKASRTARFETTKNGFVHTYIHPGARLGVMVMLQADKDVHSIKNDLVTLGKDICMQIAVTNPVAIDPSQVDQSLIDREKAIYKDQLIASGKPAQMLDKIIEGKLNKYYEDVCLLNQKFIKNDKLSIKQHVADFGKTHGININITEFVRFAIGK